MAEKNESTEILSGQPTAETHVSNPEVAGSFRDIFNKNRKVLGYVLGGIFVVILGIMAYHNFYQIPQEKEGQLAIFKTQRIYEADSLKLALNGDPRANIEGMIDIADNYGGKVGNLADYYAGMGMLRQGKYEDAIDYLKKFNSDSKIMMPMALGGIGDAYCQMKNYDEAADYYMKAAKKDDNDFTAPRFYKKAGLVYESQNQPDKAREVYQIIKDKYKATREGMDIDKYLARATASAGGK